MNLAASSPAWLLLLVGLLLLIAAAEDLWRLRISNLTSIAVLLAGFLAVGLSGFSPSVWQNFLMFGLVLAVGTFLFSAGFFGGGDVKLFAAIAFWFNLRGVLTLVAAIFIAGGAVALVAIIIRRVRRRGRTRSGEQRTARNNQIPYGVAIAAGAVFALYTAAHQLTDRERMLNINPAMFKTATNNLRLPSPTA
ncbi:MAG: prepilin peptidase [Sphingomicrobium sp.]